MKFLLARAIVLLGCVLAASPEVWAQDVVDYINPATTKPASASGKITEEGPGGIKIRVLKETTQIPALAITQITYSLPGVNALEFRQGFTKESLAKRATRLPERRALLQESLTKFKDLYDQLKMGDERKLAARYIQFKMALVKVELAQTDPENKQEMKAALDALTLFKDAYPDGWQIVPALMTLARLQEEQGDLDAARRSYEELVANPAAPREVKRNSDLQVAQMFIRAKRYLDAENKLHSLFKDTAPGDPQRGLLQVYLVESRLAQNKLDKIDTDIKEALASSEDVRLKALAHNLLGDYFRAKKKDEDALWQYLMVDVLYSQEKDEHAKALYHLAHLFEKVQGNRFRAQQCLERLTDKSFAGNEYQRKAMAEKK